ncbi:hypothetical protein FraEuI1c_3364 [Pseudofrankia inefficax]|uniref:Uncharacterized protein n=1 Tax=Pseudofrankia inefficax (strain DSM 45817 / CECT 9037 / DDB 130130 / EuI1c) TaxID=298654 RepID=E3IWP3_PSEI1|nr:hypothetical protein FraEuI1c_3364 [Pseudofrankia inefficax]
MAPFLIVPVLLVTSFYLAWFGVENVTDSLAYLGCFTGLLMVITATVCILGALGTLDHWYSHRFEISGLLALFGSVTALVANAMLLVATVREGIESVPYFVTWGLLAVASGWSCYVVYHTSVVIPSPKKVAVAASATAVIAMANFGYTQLYQPYHEEPRPILDAKFGSPTLSADRKTFSVPITLSVEVRGNVGVYLVGDQFVVYGRRVTTRSSGHSAPDWRHDSTDGQAELSRWTEMRTEPIEIGRWDLFGSWEDPGVPRSTTRLVQLPVDTPYDQLGVRAEFVSVRRDRVRLEPAFGSSAQYSWQDFRNQRCGSGPGDCVRYRGRVAESNSVARHTRDPRYLTLWWNFGPTLGTVGLESTIARRGDVDRSMSSEESSRLWSRYGLEKVTASATFRSLLDIKH